MSNFFKDLKVVELSSVLAGPAVGMFFAELGANVIKVENKKTEGDVTREWRTPGESAEGVSAYYSAVNYKKKTIQADLSKLDDRAHIYNEIEKSDIVISNFSEKIAKKLKVDYSTLRELNPELIFLQLDGFADSGRPAYDVVLQAETGWISMTGTEDTPAKLPVALIDIIAGHQLKEGALLALIHRMRTGEGSLVRCNLEEASLSALANQATNYLMNGVVAQPIGTLHPNIAPYGDWFATSDQKRIVLAVGSDAQFEKLNHSLGLKLHEDLRFSTNPERVMNRKELSEKLKNIIGTLNLESLSANFNAANIPFGVIKSLDEVLEGNAAKSMIRMEEIESRDTVRLSGNAFTADFLNNV